LLCLQFPEKEIDLNLQYINDFAHEAHKQLNKKDECIAYEKELVTLWNNYRLDEFEKKANEYLPHFKEIGELETYFMLYKQLLILQYANNKISYDHAIENTKQMYAEAKQEDCLYGIIQACTLLSRVYSEAEYYEDAEKYSKETLKHASNLIKKEPEESCYEFASEGYYILTDALFCQKKTKELLVVMSDWKKQMTAYEKKNHQSDPYLVPYFKYCAYICLDKGKCNEAELYCDSMQSISVPVEEQHIWQTKASICEHRKEFDSAIYWIDKTIDQISMLGELNTVIRLQKDKARILSKMGRTEELYMVLNKVIQINDSLLRAKNKLHIDEIRTQYEVDKHIAKNKLEHSYFITALVGFILAIIALGIWILYDRKITQKNRLLAQQIKELTAQQEWQVNEMLDKTSFLTIQTDDSLCVESRMDKLCIAVRDLLLKDKIYRDSTITQDIVIKRLGTSRHIFAEAMEYCLKMKFKDYVNLLRLKDAVQLLEQTDLSMEEISDKVGFGIAQTFRNQFRDKYKMTPTDYRNLIKTTTSISAEKS